MNFFKVLEKLKKKQISQILFCLLDRIPIVVMSKDVDKIDDFLIELSELIFFRKEIIFFNDFVSSEEYEELIRNEDLDYNSQRIHVRCPCNVSHKALDNFDTFKSWILGVQLPLKIEETKHLEKKIQSTLKNFLKIIISKNDISIEIEGLNPKELELTLENTILQKILSDTERSIIRMSRVLSEKIKISEMDKDLLKTLLDFDVEKLELQKSIFKEEVQKFYSGSKRAFFILNRLGLMNNLNLNTKIGSKTLLETIDYEEAPIERIISFIEKEWGVNYYDLIENGRNIFVGDKIQSLWG